MITTILVHGGWGGSSLGADQMIVSVRSLLLVARMGYPISAESHRILEDLGQLRTAARALLDEASPGAREEWIRFENRFPSDVEIRKGLIALSKPELEEMWSKARRFRDILAAGRRRVPLLSRGGADRDQSGGSGDGDRDASPAVSSTDQRLDIGIAGQK